jgi:hypothetical protein
VKRKNKELILKFEFANSNPMPPKKDDTEEKKRRALMGQFFTPQRIVDIVIEQAKKLKVNTKQCLEPSCGTGSLTQAFKDLKVSDENIDVCELDDSLVKQHKKDWPKLNTIHDDFITHNFENLYTLVIANPPYVELKNINKQKRENYLELFPEVGGKVNLYSIFVLKCMYLLKNNGYGFFIIPSSIRTGPSFQKTREALGKVSSIVADIELGKFDDEVSQDTILLILKKHSELEGGPSLFFDYGQSKVNLRTMGFNCQNGQFVWNEHKEEMQEDPEDDSSMIFYASNIPKDENKGFVEIKVKKGDDDKRKYQYTSFEGKSTVNLPAIFVSRTVGSRTKPRLSYTLVEKCDYPILVENHVFAITHKDGLKKLEKLLKILSQPSTNDYLRKVCGSLNLSKCQLMGIPG